MVLWNLVFCLKSSYMGIVKIGELLYLCRPKMNEMARMKYNITITWKKYHRWFGLVLSVFMLVFCVSGIILNHREAFSGCEVSRKWLPSSYHIKDFNNGIVKGTVVKNASAQSAAVDKSDIAQSAAIDKGDSILVYGCAGVFLTDSHLSTWQDFNRGLPKSIDERNVRHLVKAKDGSLWCAALRDVYRYDEGSKQWRKVALPGNEERIMDVALAKDSLQVVALTRSRIFEITPMLPNQELKGASSALTSSGEGRSSEICPEVSGKTSGVFSKNVGSFFEKYRVESKVIPAPKNYEPKTTLFKIVWHLHSGEFFGLPGKLVVDGIALVLIVLSLTGILLFILPYGMRRAKKVKRSLAAKVRMKWIGKQFAWNMKWHNKIGYVTIVLTLWVAITGMCLRPPLMVPLVLSQLPQSVGEDGNVWQDKLRAIRWDAVKGDWLVSTSEGFLRVDEGFEKAPRLLAADECPKLSPMGVTVFESDGRGSWIIGSFRGMYRWILKGNEKFQVLDYFTNKPSVEISMIPISDHLVCGYSEDFFGGKPLAFDFAKGVEYAKGQPIAVADYQEAKSGNQEAKSGTQVSITDKLNEIAPMSLWNVALELHVGRCYSPFLGPLSDLFVFLSGLLITLVLLSGYIISHRRRKKAQTRKKA